ncbi:MAG: hypothetical protein ACRDQ4_26965 [Pseudonocardiaceae bacterium]
MSRIVKWIGKNADGLIAVVLAACVAILSWAHVVETAEVSSAILLILAVLTTTLLRDRVRSGVLERDVRTALDRLQMLDTKIIEAQQTLDQASNLRVLRGTAIGKALAAGRRDTDSWTFKGGTGTFLRAVTLPACIQRAREVGRALTVRHYPGRMLVPPAIPLADRGDRPVTDRHHVPVGHVLALPDHDPDRHAARRQGASIAH